ncbi:MAG: recombination regulator RecX, partial [Methylotenera sp.]|nr:recombination regulator RecX [Methylotenera sp.]
LTELENARGICRKKYKTSPASREDWAKQARFLQSRGFGFDVIKKVLNSTNDEDNL